MDDTIRQEEKDICERWAKDHAGKTHEKPLYDGLRSALPVGANVVI
jgi:hypothetical protein